MTQWWKIGDGESAWSKQVWSEHVTGDRVGKDDDGLERERLFGTGVVQSVWFEHGNAQTERPFGTVVVQSVWFRHETLVHFQVFS